MPNGNFVVVGEMLVGMGEVFVVGLLEFKFMYFFGKNSWSSLCALDSL